MPDGAAFARWTWALAEQVIGLRDEARRAGDHVLAETCEKALAGERESRIACMHALIKTIAGRA